MAFKNGCQCEECLKLPEEVGHFSDCAVHNQPSMPKGNCTCGLKIYDKVEIKNFKNIPEISCYNHNYYIGLKRLSFTNDLLFAWSNDDNDTNWYLVTDAGHKPIGYSYTSDGEKEYIRFYPHEMT